ncbi:hypothetical protein KIPB_008329, partial [Kipferlia bialata]
EDVTRGTLSVGESIDWINFIPRFRDTPLCVGVSKKGKMWGIGLHSSSVLWEINVSLLNTKSAKKNGMLLVEAISASPSTVTPPTSREADQEGVSGLYVGCADGTIRTVLLSEHGGAYELGQRMELPWEDIQPSVKPDGPTAKRKKSLGEFEKQEAQKWSDSLLSVEDALRQSKAPLSALPVSLTTITREYEGEREAWLVVCAASGALYKMPIGASKSSAAAEASYGGMDDLCKLSMDSMLIPSTVLEQRHCAVGCCLVGVHPASYKKDKK